MLNEGKKMGSMCPKKHYGNNAGTFEVLIINTVTKKKDRKLFNTFCETVAFFLSNYYLINSDTIIKVKIH